MSDLLDICLRYRQEGFRDFGYVESRPLAIDVLSSALVTKRDYWPGRIVTGAVYDSSGLLHGPALRPSTAPEDLSHGDPETIDRTAIRPTKRLGTALYGGVLFGTLGHFLFETLARLWMLTRYGPRGGPDRPVVAFHPWPDLYLPDIFRNPLYVAILRAFGLRRRDIVLVHLEDVGVETLYCPAPLSVMHRSLDPRMAGLFDTVADHILRSGPFGLLPARPRGTTLFLSRGRWSANSRIRDESSLDRLFAARGFDVLHPHELAPRDLLSRLRNADLVAATDGSHAHLAAFCRPGTRILMLDTRPVPTQFAIARLRGLPSFHIPLEPTGLLRDAVLEAGPALGSAIDAAIRQDAFAAPGGCPPDGTPAGRPPPPSAGDANREPSGHR